MSDNYMGNRDLPSNYSADHIPDHCNTSLWIFGLPSQITVHQLLKTIRGFGRIFAIHINEPEIDKGHFLAAAKVTFFEAAAAQRFLFKHRSSGLPVGSLIASVRPNRVKVEEKQFSESCSRVIVAIGPRELTTQAWIHDQLRRRGIYYDIDEILEHTNHPAGSARLEFRFGSYRGQASQAYRVLRGSEARERGIVVFFGEDPCA
ncbi:hypothetical protein QBC41DRAFT_232107 [Cercophora samala]|uniref:RRM domain-containing protein n=1 Tax=Cercophora samala TaxID=330535 RepID=A0AA40D777_9PEZI|nr:hypothetical protein QBC41DRAFT_232107 [Cercophora samala]